MATNNSDSTQELDNITKSHHDNNPDINDGPCLEKSQMLARDDVNNDDAIDDTKEEVVEEAVKEKAPDGGWGWFIVLGSCFVHVLMGEIINHFFESLRKQIVLL